MTPGISSQFNPFTSGVKECVLDGWGCPTQTLLSLLFAAGGKKFTVTLLAEGFSASPTSWGNGQCVVKHPQSQG